MCRECPLHGAPLSTRMTLTLSYLMIALTALLAVVPPVSSEDLKGVNLTLSLDVRDPEAWFEAYQDILATPNASPEALLVTIVPRTPRRSIAIMEPRFSAIIGVSRPSQPIRVVVTGKMSGKVALVTLQAFLYALYAP